MVNRMQISNRLLQARESGTVRLSQQVRDLKASGKEIYGLAEGEPDFDTPGFVIEAAFEAARQGQTRYTAVAGIPELREAVAAKFRAENNIACEAQNVIVGTGGKQLIFNALLSTLNPGDEVVIPAPYWVSYPDIVSIADGEAVIVDCPKERGFKITAWDCAREFNRRTRWLLLNSPNNPTGAVYSRSELEEIARVLRDWPRIYVMCDDIYEKILFGDQGFVTMSEVAPDLNERVLTVNGVSKAYAMTGWRLGYGAGPPGLIAAMTKLQGQSTTNASSVGQAAALAALTGPQDYLDDWLATYERRCKAVGFALSTVKGLEINWPKGAFYHFVGCANLLGRRTPNGSEITSDVDLCAYLLQKAGVAVVPGSAFGCPGYFRLCFAKSDRVLERACMEIAAAVVVLT